MPLEVYVSKFSHMRFEPSGLTNDADIRVAKSIVDYIFRWMGKKFLTTDQQEEAGILSPEVKARLAQAYATLEGGQAPVEYDAPAARPDGALQRLGGRGRVRPLRRPDGADGLVLHVPRLRHEHRLQLMSGVAQRAVRMDGRPVRYAVSDRGATSNTGVVAAAYPDGFAAFGTA